MNILSNLFKLIKKFPIKTIMIAVVAVVLLAIGVSNISMATGNDTMVKTNTDVYQDNLTLEEEFGGEAIIVLYESDTLLTPGHLKHMKGIENELRTHESIYTIMSPVTLVEEIAKKQSDEFQDGISNIIEGLDDMGSQLIHMSEEIEGNMQGGTDEQVQKTEALNVDGELSDQLDEIAENLLLLSVDMENPSKKEQVVEAGQKLSGLSKQFAQILENPENLPGNPDQIRTMNDGLSEMGTNVQSISENMGTIEEYSDIMSPGLPEKQGTLDQMIYEDGNLRTMFEEVVVDDNHMLMMITFNGNTSDTEKSNVVDTIHSYLDFEAIDSVNTIVSGKPVLDNSIRSSMQESIQKMMGLALIIMIVVLFLVFKVRWRLLPLATVLIAVVGTVGLMGWLEIPITMVSMAVFPIIIGLGIDYAIQFQTRYTEEMAKEDSNE